MRRPLARRLGARTILVSIALSMALLGGCKRYYRVTDLETGDLYYTDHINKKDKGFSGILNFVDGSTGAVITLEDYEYKKIGRRAFRHAVAEPESK